MMSGHMVHRGLAVKEGNEDNQNRVPKEEKELLKVFFN